MPASALKVVQLGEESAWGTAVVATVKLMAVTDAKLRPVTETGVIPTVGAIGPGTSAIQRMLAAEGMIEAAATYEDLPYFLEMLFGEVAPSAGPPYTRAYVAPYAAISTPRIHTVEFGATGASYKMTGALLSTLNIKIESGMEWVVAVELLGKAVSTVSLAALSNRTVEVIRAADTIAYLDAFGGTIGTTAVSGTVISAELNVDTKRHLKQFVGSVSPADWGDDRFEGTLALTVEFNATGKALVDAHLTALTQRLIRLKATSGTKVAQLDFAGTLTGDPELFEDRDGNMTASMTFEGTYETGFANWLKASVTNSVATLA